MHVLFSDNIDQQTIILDEQDSIHCIQVLRLKEGDLVNIIDGKGSFLVACIEEANRKAVRLRITKRIENFRKRDYYLHIAIAPTKNSKRFDFFIEKAVEFGIDRISPLLCQRSERKAIKPERIKKQAIAAMKQSQNAWKPVIDEMTPFSDFIVSDTDAKKCIAHCDESEKVKINDIVDGNKEVLIMIGPEGDFTPQEIELAKNNGFAEISLGQMRLRTETAGILACSSMMLANN